jgi:hypothetical protein
MIRIPNRRSGDRLYPIQPFATSDSITALETHKKEKSDYNENKKRDGKKKPSKFKSNARLDKNKAKSKPWLSAPYSIKPSHFQSQFFNLSSPTSFINNLLKIQTKNHHHACY